jgi:hypothetical protein
MKTTIEIKGDVGFFHTNCTTCGEEFLVGGNSNKLSICEGDCKIIDGIICDTCATRGVDNLRVNLFEQAMSIRIHAEERASFLEAMATGKIVLPAPDEAKAEIKKSNSLSQEMWRGYEDLYGDRRMPLIIDDMYLE